MSVRTVLVVGIVAVLGFAASFPLQLWNFSAAEVERRLVQPESQFVVLDGTRVHFMDQGPRDGPAIVLLHNDRGSLFIFDRTVPHLIDTYRVVRLDLLSYGLTGEAADGDYTMEHNARIVGLLADHLKLDRFVLVGISTPAVAAFRYASAHPERVTALVLSNAAGLPRLPDQKLNLPNPNPVLNWIYGYFRPRAEVESHYVDIKYPLGVPADVMNADYVMNNRRDRYLERRKLMSQYKVADHQAILGRIASPVLILWGEFCELKPGEAERFKAWLTSAPTVEIKVYENVGHLLFTDAGERAARDIRAFATSISAATDRRTP